jgi:hypothetical protein
MVVPRTPQQLAPRNDPTVGGGTFHVVSIPKQRRWVLYVLNNPRGKFQTVNSLRANPHPTFASHSKCLVGASSELSGSVGLAHLANGPMPCPPTSRRLP